MPTGTGKTDTMIAALVAHRVPKLLVVVPSDALREQLAASFASLGVLRELGLVDAAVKCPVVGKLSGGLDSADDARQFADLCNVIVTTPNSLSVSDLAGRNALLDEVTHLFIDEAHHVTAPKWSEVRERFLPKPVVQFTATPFRRDGAHLGGMMIYAFPLREAQAEGYFSKIRYRQVLSIGNADQTIAGAAIAQLRQDLADGFDHLLMARVDSIQRAREVFDVYRKIAPDLNPQIAHSRTPKTEVLAAIAALRGEPRQARILVCVDMFGEGFDLPQLKVAALHDQHRSLAITMQFIGRFARSGKSKLGSATVVAARSEVRHIDPLRRLYSEDADWNDIVEDISAEAVEGQQEEDEFTRAFNEQPERISIHTLTPAMSAVVYQPHVVEWHPEMIHEVFGEDRFIAGPAVNSRDGVAWFVVRTETDLRWSTTRAVDPVTFDLYVLYWDVRTGLLYIHSSNNDSVHESLARAVTRNIETSPIAGRRVYRVFDRVQRLTPTNIGLLDSRSRSRRYTSYVGSDVTEAFPTAERQNKAQTHIAGTGFLSGSRYTIAGSMKGRVWSHRLAHTLKEWTAWCDVIGPKLIDDSIDIDRITEGFILPEEIDTWPDLHVLAIEWLHDFQVRMEEYDLRVDAVRCPFAEVEIRIDGPPSGHDLPISVVADGWEVKYLLRLDSEGMRVIPTDATRDVEVQRARLPALFSSLVSSAVGRHVGLRVLLEGDSVIEPPGFLVRPRRDLEPFNRDQLRTITWDGVNLHAESWGEDRDPATVQGRMVDVVLDGEWDVVIDDDGTGEIADIVALRVSDDRLEALFVHCKYSSGDRPGARVADLYEVVGQAMRSAAWRRDFDGMIRRLMKRERRRAARDKSGLIVGDFASLTRIWEQSDRLLPALDIVIAQPGLSAEVAGDNHLQLLASAEAWIAETAGSSLKVYCSV